MSYQYKNLPQRSGAAEREARTTFGRRTALPAPPAKRSGSKVPLALAFFVVTIAVGVLVLFSGAI